MSGAPGPRAQQRLAEIEALQSRVHTIHGLVERFAAERGAVAPHVIAVRRAFARLKVELAGMGFDTMAQVCASMELAARRGGSQPFKAGILREGVGSLRMQLDVEERAVRAEADAARTRNKGQRQA